MSRLYEALAKAREGDVEGAILCLETDEEIGLEGLSLLYMFQQRLHRPERALLTVERALVLATEGLPRSTWELRRASTSIELGQRSAALAALQAVLKLRASEDHIAQAHQGLLSLTDVC